eukprot:m.295091 g.295091  ORF g.295091 m.295091 type:complete len:124 (+) comp16393_c5_seq3:2204-2575(+)
MDWANGDNAAGMGLIALGHSGSDTFASMFPQYYFQLASLCSKFSVCSVDEYTLLYNQGQLLLYNTKQPLDIDQKKGYFHPGFSSELFTFSIGYNIFTNENDGRGIGDPHFVPWTSANSLYGLV